MRFKGTAILFVLLAVLAGWVYWTEIRGREEREQAAEAAALALPVDAEEISRITLVQPEETLTGARTDSGWEFVSPPGLEAAAEEWDRLAGNVVRVEKGEVVASGAAVASGGAVASDETDLEAFGLATPSLEIRLQMADGTEESMLFGSENPAATHNYVKLASNGDIFLSPTTWHSLLSVGSDGLRDKTVLRFEQDTIVGVDISAGNVSLEKIDGSWQLTSPIRAAADPAVVTSFLSTLGNARATEFADSIANLDPADLEVALTTDGGERHRLLVSSSGEEPDRYYARDIARDPVFVVTDSIVAAAEKSPFEWRDKSVTNFDRFAVTSMVLESADARIVLNGQDDDWDLAGEGPASAARVSGLLSDLEFARATDIIDSPDPLQAYGLEAPRVRVVLGGENGTTLLAFGFGADAADDGVYWKAEDQEVVKVVPRSLFESFSVRAEDLIEEDPDATAP